MAYKLLKGHVILPPDSLPKVKHSIPTRLCNQVLVRSCIELKEHSDIISISIIVTAQIDYCYRTLYGLRRCPCRGI